MVGASRRLRLCKSMQSRKRRSMRITSRLTKEFRVGRIRIVARMERPAIVLLDKTPGLFRQSVWQRVSLDVRNCPPDFVWVVQEDFPSSPAPSWVRGWSMRARDELLSARRLEKFYHFFC